MPKLAKVSRTLRRKIIERAMNQWEKRCQEKGDQIYHSRHEGIGVLEEELLELKEAIRKKGTEEMEAEAMDCIVPLLHLLASIDTGGMKW